MSEIGILVEHLEHSNFVLMRLENLGHLHAKMGVPMETLFTMNIVMQHYFRELYSRQDVPDDCEGAWSKVTLIWPSITGFQTEIILLIHLLL